MERNEALTHIGNAMQIYAAFEFNLFNLVELLLEAPRERAASVFYSMKSYRDRNAMTERLLAIRCGDERRRFRKSLLKWVNLTDETRNRLAHGLLVPGWQNDEPFFVIAKPVEYWIPDWPTGEGISMQDVNAYSERTSQLMEVMRRFTGVLNPNNGMPEDLRSEWSDGCQDAFNLPLPDGHPLKPN